VKTWLLDTGPLVAYLDANDAAHAVVAACLEAFRGQLCTTSAVITEAMYFISIDRRGPTLLAEFVDASNMQVYDCAQPAQVREAALLMKKYSDTPMDFADATLVLLAEQLNVLNVVTLDRRGFSTYRTRRGKSLRMMP
jgi:predicted nucleic acid-binding protein